MRTTSITLCLVLASFGVSAKSLQTQTLLTVQIKRVLNEMYWN